MKRVWKGAIISGVVGLVYAIIGIYYSFVSGFVGYACPIKVSSWVAVVFYPTLSLTCLSFFRSTGMIGFFIYSLLAIIIFVFVGGILGKCFIKKL